MKIGREDKKTKIIHGDQINLPFNDNGESKMDVFYKHRLGYIRP